jgi:hypothetical protein
MRYTLAFAVTGETVPDSTDHVGAPAAIEAASEFADATASTIAVIANTNGRTFRFARVHPATAPSIFSPRVTAGI